MGEVYRARDERLGRDVAVKVLPSHVAGDPELRQRFEREARALATLSHPHICPVFDVGRHEGIDFLVMEYLEGETLAHRLSEVGRVPRSGPAGIPLDQALRYGIEIADALGKAHRKGIVHRDLKPANIMLTRAGAKLLDFGLVKVVGPSQDGPYVQDDRSVRLQPNLSGTPTVSVPFGAAHGEPLTDRGSILGTVQYMAPEQLEGQEADARTDIFAFGAVLYEMLTGRKPFEGKSQASVMAAILEREPPTLTRLMPSLPPSLDHLVRRCLAKEPDKRWQSALDLMAQLEWIQANRTSAEESTASRAGKGTRTLPWAIAGVVIVLLAVLAVTAFRRARAPEEQQQIQFLVTSPGMYGAFALPNMAVSPDGRWLAFTVSSGSRMAIAVRSVASTELVELEGTEDAGTLFWSPDSRYIGFFTAQGLRKVAVDGGPPQDIASFEGNKLGATWSSEGVIVFSGGNVLYQVSDAGGDPQPLDVDGSATGSFGRYPAFLADGRRFLYLSRPGEGQGIYVASLDGGSTTRVLDVASRTVPAQGHLFYQREGTLFGHRFDERTLTFAGEPVRVAQQILYSVATGNAAFSVSTTGVLAYQGGGAAANFQFAWFDQTGKEQGRVGKPAPYRYSFDLSPDGRQIVVSLAGDLWLLDSQRDVMTRITSGPGDDSDVVWSPDGTRIAFTSDRNGYQDLFEKNIAAMSAEMPLLTSTEGKWAEDWSPDGRYLSHIAPNRIDVLPLFGDRKPFPIVRVRSNEPHVSPDGKWLAYDSDESGAWEVYVVSFPAGDRKRQISTNGGGQSRWRRDGRELYYLAPDGQMMAVEITAVETVESGTPRVLFETGLTLDPSHDQYTVTSDGQRFLIRMPVAESSPITVVVNWDAGRR